MKSILVACIPKTSRLLIALAITVFTGLSACSSSNTETAPTTDTLPEDPPSSDGLTEAQRNQLPNDCLLAFDSAGIAYCFSEPTRKFTSVNSDGTANWDYSLPGDNATNHIEGIAIIEDNRLCMVADVTDTIGDSRHEITCFDLSGEFIATHATLEPLPRLGDPVKPRDPLGINLSDESLLTEADDESLYLAGSEYLLTSDSDPLIRDSWSRIAGFVVRVSPQTGDVLAWHSFPGAEVTEIAMSEDGNIAISIETANSVTPSHVTLEADTLVTQSNTTAIDVINAGSLPRLTPQIYAAITGQPLQNAEELLLDAVSQLTIELYYGEDNFCTSFNEGLGCEYDYGPIQTTVSCPVSGSVIVAASGNSSWNSPQKSDSKTADWFFDQCIIAPTEAASDDETVHAISGRWQYVQSSSNSTIGESESTKSEFDQLTLTLIDSSEINADGNLTRLDGRLSRSNSQYDYLDGNINRSVSDGMEITDATFGYHIDRTPSGYERDSVSIEFYGQDQIGATLSSQATSGEPVRIDVPDSDLATGYAEERDYFYFLGSLYVSANDGSNVLLTALDSPDGLGSELIEYSLSSATDTATSIQRIPTASWYLPYQVTGIDPFDELYRDSDADGITDFDEGELDSDADGTPDYLDTDSDNDGIPDATEGNGNTDEYSNNPDSIPNYLDDDADGDTISDTIEGAMNSDGDDIPDFLDYDSDNDSIPDELEGSDDLDGDGKPNYLDEDCDGDGLRDQPDGVEDFDGDGLPNFLDEDSDNDGIPDSVEGYEDRDGDGRADYVDPD